MQYVELPSPQPSTSRNAASISVAVEARNDEKFCTSCNTLSAIGALKFQLELFGVHVKPTQHNDDNDNHIDEIPQDAIDENRYGHIN